MYFEEAKVKTYYRKDSKGNKKPYFQINLSNKTKFNESDTIVLVDLNDIKELETNANPEEVKELADKIKLKLEENKQLEEEVKKLKLEKYELQEELTKANDKDKEIIQLQQDHKEELAKLNAELNKEKDLTKTLLAVRNDFIKRPLIDRIRNKEPDSSKYLTKIKKK